MSDKNGQDANHHHEHEPDGHEHRAPACENRQRKILTIRSFSGLSGDMLCCGLGYAWLEEQNLQPSSAEGDKAINDMAGAIMPVLAGTIGIKRKLVNGIGGCHLRVDLPHAHEHRTPGDINDIITRSSLDDRAKTLSRQCVSLLAKCEAAVHAKSVDEVHFHEVGALDSILDICLACALYARLGIDALVCSPLPLADGCINCAHGALPAPAPAVLALLPGARVKSFGLENAGELVTPTAIAMLHTLGATFGPWPEFYVDSTALVYGSREFAGVPNGAIFAVGRADDNF